MRRNQVPSPADRERLLNGGGVEGERLNDVLAAASAPAQPTELLGLTAAVAAFRSTPAPTPDAVPQRRVPMLKSILSGVAATKVIAAAASAAAIGGVALAASTGHLGTSGKSPASPPGLAIASGHRADASTGSSGASGSSSSESSASSSAASSSAASSSAASSSAASSSAPSPSLVGLCHAWQAHENGGSASTHGKWMDSPAFTVLVTTAGGPSSVDGYCATLLAQPTSASTSGSTEAQPTHPAHPTHPVHPTNTNVPTDLPTSHGNHRPTAVPSHSHPAPTGSSSGSSYGTDTPAAP